MLSSKQVEVFTNLLGAISEGEKKCEIVKQVLAEQVLFEPYTSFKRIDQQRQGFIGYVEIVEFLDDNEIIFDKVEIFALVDKIDLDRDGTISYTDFSKYILPRQNPYLKSLANMRESYYIEPNMLLPYEVEWAIARVFHQELSNFRAQNNLKQKLLVDANLNELFDIINQGDSWDYESVAKFMELQERVLINEEIEGLFFALDRNHDKLIDYRELMRYLQNTDNPDKGLSHHNPKVLKEGPPEQLYETPERNLQNKKNPTTAKTQASTEKKQLIKFSEDLQKATCQLFRQYISVLKECQDMKKKIALRDDYNIQYIFECLLNKQQIGQLTTQDLQQSLEGIS